MTPERIKELREIIDGLHDNPWKGVLFNDLLEALDTIEAQAALIAKYHAEQSYSYIGKDGKSIKARDLEDQRDELAARSEAQQRRIEELEVDLRHLADARQAHINAVDHYNRMFEIMRYKEPGGMNITAEYHAMNDCRSEFICAAQDVAGRQIARAALQSKEPS